MSTDRLLDVFVGVRPDAQLLAATEQAIQDSVNRIRGMFGAMQNQSAAAAQNAANILNGINAGRGAGAASGGGGGNRGGRSGQTGLVPEFEQARRLAQDLQQELQVVARVIRATGAEDLTNSLQQMTDFLRRIQTDVGRQRSDQDVLGIRQSLDLLQDFRQQLQALQTRSAVTLDLRGQFDEAAQAARQAVNDERIRNRLAESLVRGTPSGDLRKQLLEARAVLQALEQQVKDVTLAFDGTQDSVDRLRASTAAFREAAQGLGEIQAQAKAAGPSFNTLTNNAYQLGQAIEDFSVGFSLNGFAGGVRGAANNVAFLLNNLVQADYIQGRISEKWKNALPIVFGIGSAVAITVLPKLVEWLTTLNDIDFKLREIGQASSDAFSDASFAAGLRRQEEEVAALARTADTTEEILSSLFESVTKANSQRLTLVEELTDFFNHPNTGLKEANRELFLLEQRLNKIGSGTSPQGGDEARRVVVQILNSVRSSRQAIAEAASDAVVDGALNTKAVERAVTSLRTVRDRFSEAVERSALPKNGLTPEDIETIQKNLEPLLSNFEEFRNKALEVSSVIDKQLAIGIDAAVKKTEELRNQQRLVRGELAGTLTDQAKFLDGLAQAGKKFQEEVNTLLAEADAAGVDPQKIAAARAAFESRNQTEIENQVLERQVALRDRIKTLDERIAEIRERMLNKQVLSRQVTTDSFIGGLQTNVLSINTNEDRERLKNLEAIKNEMLERQKLIDNLSLLNRAYSEAGDPEALKRLALRPANRFAIEPIGAFKGQDYGAVFVQNALRQMIAEQQNNTKELIRKDTTPRAQ